MDCCGAVADVDCVLLVNCTPSLGLLNTLMFLFLLLLSFVPVWSPCFRSYVCPFEAVVTLILPLHDLSQGFTRLVLELESRASRLRNCGVGRPLLSHPCHKVDSAFSRGGCGFSSAPSVIRDHLFLDRARLVQALFPLIWFAFWWVEVEEA